MPRHDGAALRATSAELGTTLHLRVVSHALAGDGALAADFCTRATYDAVHIGAPQHRVGTGAADVSAGRKQRDMVLARMLAALREAVLDGFQTNRMASQAMVDALVHARRSMGDMMCHGTIPLVDLRTAGDTASPAFSVLRKRVRGTVETDQLHGVWL